MLINYKEKNFNEIIQKKVLVDFYATWCGPCKMLSPVLEELSKEIDIDIIKVDVDENNDLAKEYGVMSIPCLILFENGKEIKFLTLFYTTNAKIPYIAKILDFYQKI